MSHEVAHGWFVAVELGAEWPAWMTDIVGSGQRRVVAQSDGETPAAFAERSLGIAAATADLAGVMLLCNERADTAQSEARSQLLGGVTRAASARNARRVIAAPAHSSERLREALSALSGRSRRGAVEVCFAKPDAPSRTSTRPVSRVA